MLALGLGAHWAYMLGVVFDYGWNMKLSLFLGVLQSMLWCRWSYVHRAPYRRSCYAFFAGLHLVALLEVLDFPPLAGLIDAHALWHLATPPLVLLWYRVLEADRRWYVTGVGAEGRRQD